MPSVAASGAALYQTSSNRLEDTMTPEFRRRGALTAAACVIISAAVLGEDKTSAGAPKIGDEAPTFKLNALDGKSETDLAAYRGKRPVVLFFGSYT
jgi:hypothetical protein